MNRETLTSTMFMLAAMFVLFWVFILVTYIHDKIVFNRKRDLALSGLDESFVKINKQDGEE